MIATLLALAVFQSAALLTLAYDLEPSSVGEMVVMACETWNDWMDRLGAAGVTQTIADFMVEVHEKTVGGEEF